MALFSMYHKDEKDTILTDEDVNTRKVNMLKFDLSDPKQKRSAMFLAFHPANADQRYINTLKALPVIPGLKRKSKRAEFVFDLITNLKSIEKNHG